MTASSPLSTTEHYCKPKFKRYPKNYLFLSIHYYTVFFRSQVPWGPSEEAGLWRSIEHPVNIQNETPCSDSTLLRCIEFCLYLAPTLSLANCYRHGGYIFDAGDAVEHHIST